MIEKKQGSNTSPSNYVMPIGSISNDNPLADFINPPAGWSNATGLFMMPSIDGDAAHMGYASNGTWSTYMDSNGDFFLKGADAASYLTWDSSSNQLSVTGSINATGGTLTEITNGQALNQGASTQSLSLWDISEAQNNELNNSVWSIETSDTIIGDSCLRFDTAESNQSQDNFLWSSKF